MGSRIPELAKAVKENPDDSFYKFALALELIKADQLDKAKVLFENIRNKDPEYAGVYYHLGKLLERLNEFKKAVEVYKEGIVISEKQNDAQNVSELKAALLSLEMELETEDGYENEI